MTLPNLLALARRCAKWYNGVLVVAFLVPIMSSAPRDSTPRQPSGIRINILSAGDTLIYGVSWGAAQYATTYGYTMGVTASNGTWSVVADSNASGKWVTGNGVGALPSSSTVTTLNLKTWVSAIPWDSATFTISVTGINAKGTGPARVQAFKIRRTPGQPGPITVDSSGGTFLNLIILPDGRNLGLGQSTTVCAFQQFTDSAVVEWTSSKPACDSIYTRYVPLALRQKVKPSQQAHTDSLATTCVTNWRSTNPIALTVTQIGACQPVATAFGAGLTWKFRQFPDATRVGMTPPSLARPILGAKSPRIG